MVWLAEFDQSLAGFEQSRDFPEPWGKTIYQHGIGGISNADPHNGNNPVATVPPGREVRVLGYNRIALSRGERPNLVIAGLFETDGPDVSCRETGLGKCARESVR